MRITLAVRKERAEAAKEKTDREAALRTAARLIANEFLRARTVANIAIEHRQWVADAKLPLDGWRSGRTIIARELPYHDWRAVETAALVVEHFELFHSFPRKGDEVEEHVAKAVDPIIKDITAGLDALRPYVLDK